jgi:nitrilase
MVIDPWGMVVAQVPDRVGHAAASIDLDQLADIRTKLPVANHHILPL